MRSSWDYAGFAQLCTRSPIMRKIMRAHNRIIQRSLACTSFDRVFLWQLNGDDCSKFFWWLNIKQSHITAGKCVESLFVALAM